MLVSLTLNLVVFKASAPTSVLISGNLETPSHFVTPALTSQS